MKNYNIVIETKIYSGEETTKLYLEVEGGFDYKNELYYIFYYEPAEHNMGRVRTTIVVNGNESVQLRRTGDNNHKIFINKDKKTKVNYSTEHGSIIFHVKYIDIINTLGSKDSELYFRYNLEIEENCFSEHEVNIKIKEK